MDARIMRLVRHYKLSEGVAQALTDGGYPLPRKIRAASDENLLGLPRFTQDIVDEIRQKVG